MGVQQTSIDAYNQLRDSGRLSRQRKLVYDALAVLQRTRLPTSYELFEAMKDNGLVHDLNDVRPKLTELKKRGLVENPAKRVCRVTQKRAMVWRIVEAMPIPSKAPRKRRAAAPVPARLF